MKRTLITALLAWPLAAADPPDFWARLHASVEKYLGRPYIWGASGMKSFDCSGFVWRVNYENGVFIRRTTARKYYFSLPRAAPGDESKFGTVVFFDNFKHCGIVNDAGTFYHAQTSVGTNLSHFDPYWRPLVCGYRRITSEELPARPSPATGQGPGSTSGAAAGAAPATPRLPTASAGK